MSVRAARGSVWRAIPGLVLAVAVMLGAGALARWLGSGLLRLQGIEPSGRPSPISGISAAILLGLAIANTTGTAELFRPGLAIAVRWVLRAGIILVGVKLSFFDVVKLGAWGVPVVTAIIVAALLTATWLARALRLSDRLGILAAASTAICGVTAAVAVGPAIDAEESEIAYTVANVTLFGLAAMLAYPFLAHALFGADSGAIGLFLGTGIHDTSQVMGAALSFRELFGDERAFEVATVTKLTRNVFLAAVVPGLAFLHGRRAGKSGGRVQFKKYFPLFVLGFLAMAIARSLGDAAVVRGGLAFGALDGKEWNRLTRTLGETWSAAALGTAMAGVGLTTNLRSLRLLGARPLYLGAVSAVLVAGLALLLAALVGPHL